MPARRQRGKRYLRAVYCGTLAKCEFRADLPVGDFYWVPPLSEAEVHTIAVPLIVTVMLSK